MSIFLINGDGIDETTSKSFTLQFKQLAEDHMIPWADTEPDLRIYRSRELAAGSILWPQSADMFQYGSFFSTIGEISAGDMTYDATNKYYYNASPTYSVEPATTVTNVLVYPSIYILPSFVDNDIFIENDDGVIYGDIGNFMNGTERNNIIRSPNNYNLDPDDFLNQLYIIYRYHETTSGNLIQARLWEDNTDTSATWATSVDGPRNSSTAPVLAIGNPWHYTSISVSFANRAILRWYWLTRTSYTMGTTNLYDKEIDAEYYLCFAHKQYQTKYLETQSFVITENTLVVHPFIRKPGAHGDKVDIDFNLYFNVYYYNGSGWTLIDKYIPNDVTSMIGNTSRLKFEWAGPIDTLWRPEFYGFMMINYKRGE